MLPSTTTWPAVSAAASQDLYQLFYDPVILPLEDRLKAMDEESVPIFTPPETPSPSETPSPTGTP